MSAPHSTSRGKSRRRSRSEEHTSELQSPCNLVCRLLLEKKKTNTHLSLAVFTLPLASFYSFTLSYSAAFSIISSRLIIAEPIAFLCRLFALSRRYQFLHT